MSVCMFLIIIHYCYRKSYEKFEKDGAILFNYNSNAIYFYHYSERLDTPNVYKASLSQPEENFKVQCHPSILVEYIFLKYKVVTM